MKAPFQIVPINEAVGQVIDACGENVAVMPTRPAARLIELVNLIPVIAGALEQVAIEMWSSGDANMAAWACAIEGVVKRVNPAFALAGTTSGVVCLDCESSLYAAAVLSALGNVSDCAPQSASPSLSGVDNPSGSQSR